MPPYLMQLLAGFQQQQQDPMMAMLQQVMAGRSQQQPFDITSLIREARNTPVQDANNAHDARLAADPWAEGGLFANRPQLSPEARAASQGLNATNQWAMRGQVPGVDPQKLAGMMPMAPTPEQNRQKLGAAGLIQPPAQQPMAPVSNAFDANTTGKMSFGTNNIPGQTPQRQGTINGMPAQQAIDSAYPAAQQARDKSAFAQQQEASLNQWRGQNPDLANNIANEVYNSRGIPQNQRRLNKNKRPAIGASSLIR